MSKTILTALIVGLITGLIVGVVLHGIPFIDDLIPDSWNGFITGGLSGMMAVLFMNKKKSS